MKPKYLREMDGICYIRDNKISDIAKQFQTPLYLFDEFELNENLSMFKNNFCSKFFNTDIVYASKAFLVPYFIKMLQEKNYYIDAVSLGDLYILKSCNYDMKKVVFHGNNKTNEELLYAIKENVGLIVVDHLGELEDIIKIANELKIKVNTLFRINPGISAHTHKYIQTATFVSKFGESLYDHKIIDKIMKLYKNNKFVILKGFHSHIGSQIQEIEPFLVNIEKMMRFTKDIIDTYNYELSYIDFGGGFGIEYTDNDIPLDVIKTLNMMIAKIEEVGNKIKWLPKECLIEPGRSILGNSGVTLYTCGDLKQTFGDKNFLFIDGGMTDNIRPALYQAEYCCDLADKINKKKDVIVDIAGKCCESGDIIVHNAVLPLPNKGDTLIVYATGAYTFSMFSNYNNSLRPAVVFLADHPHIVSRRETLNDLLKLF